MVMRAREAKERTSSDEHFFLFRLDLPHQGNRAWRPLHVRYQGQSCFIVLINQCLLTQCTLDSSYAPDSWVSGAQCPSQVRQAQPPLQLPPELNRPLWPYTTSPELQGTISTDYCSGSTYPDTYFCLARCVAGVFLGGDYERKNVAGPRFGLGTGFANPEEQ
jgi:hypothetical protein